MIQTSVSAGSPEAPRPPVVMVPRNDLDQAPQFEPFNPRTVSPDVFWGLPGGVQEFVLKEAIKEGDLANVARLRPDFEMEHPVSRYEQIFTRAIREITASADPITESPGYVSVATFLPNNSEVRARVEVQLQAERARRQEDPNSLHYSHEDIAGYKAGRRYRILLEDQVAQEVADEAQAAQEAAKEAERRRAYDAKVEARDNRRKADIRAELTAMQGGLSAQDGQAA